MPRCFLEPCGWSGDEVRLDAEESRHLTRVLRTPVGACVEVFDGQGRSAEGSLARIEDRHAVVRLGPVRQEQHPGPMRILAQALVKGEKADLIVQKAVELGVDRIAWFDAERSVVRLDEARAARRIARWRSLAIQAAKQCGRSRVPDIVRYPSVAALCAVRAPGEAWFFGSLGARTRPARDALSAPELRAASALCVAIGPEGDFTPDEEARLVEAGAVPVSLGPRVLRTETAALYVMAVMAYEQDAG